MDVGTGLYYMQTRFYDPRARRFINADNYMLLPVLSAGMQLNMYSYAANNPVMNVDRTGQLVITATVKAILIGVAIGAAVGGTTSGIAAHNAGLDWRSGNFWLAVGAGVLVGGALGAAAPMGAAAMLGTVGGGAVLALAGITFGAGLAGYAMETRAFGREFNTRDMFMSGGRTLLQGTLAFGLGMVTAGAGLWGTDMANIGALNTAARLMFMQPILLTGNYIIDILFTAFA